MGFHELILLLLVFTPSSFIPSPWLTDIFRPFVGYKEVRLVSKESRRVMLFLLFPLSLFLERKFSTLMSHWLKSLRQGGDPLVLCFVDFLSPAHAATAMDALQGELYMLYLFFFLLNPFIDTVILNFNLRIIFSCPGHPLSFRLFITFCTGWRWLVVSFGSFSGGLMQTSRLNFVVLGTFGNVCWLWDSILT